MKKDQTRSAVVRKSGVSGRTAQALDVFAQIAEQTGGKSRGRLIVPPPPPRPANVLPLRMARPGALPLPPAPRVDEAELARALLRRQRWAAPFLRDLAPPLSDTRKRMPMEDFQWRLETPEDVRDAARALRGAGRWTVVRVPHYGGPIGRAVALYRREFELPGGMPSGRRAVVCFRGVDYTAQVFVNGRFLGAHEGFFAPFEFDFTEVARPGKNVLLVRVENDQVMLGNDSWGQVLDGDKIYAATGPGWDEPGLGWHHCPPGMGIYQPVRVELRAPLHVADLFVRPLPAESRAELWLDVRQAPNANATFAVRIAVHGLNFKATALRAQAPAGTLAAGPGLNHYRFTLPLPGFRWWSPDAPWLYRVQVDLLDEEGGRLDAATRTFGMRSFQMDTEHAPRGRMYLNGREIKLRGANTMGFEQQAVMRGDDRQLTDDLLLAREGGLNFLRLTQRPVQEEVYDRCDRLGLLTQTDLPLFGLVRRRQFAEVVRQAGEMERLVRVHPCNVMVTFINEPFPPALRGKVHRHLNRVELEDCLAAASGQVRVENPDRVIKPVDGDYEPPAAGLPDNHCYNLWYNGHEVSFGRLYRGWWREVKPGWNYACGEFGAEGLDFGELMRRRYPKAWLPGPHDDHEWTPARIFRAQTAHFQGFFYDRPAGLSAWVSESQRFQAWAVRQMTEAFRRDDRMVSFAVHLFKDAFPAGWMKALVDGEGRPKPAFFAYRDALAPLLVTLRGDRWSCFAGETLDVEAWVCNDTHETLPGARLRYQILWRGKPLQDGEAPARLEPLRSVCRGVIRVRAPAVAGRGELGVRLALVDAAGRTHSTADWTCAVFSKPGRPHPGPILLLDRPAGPAAMLLRECGANPWRGRAWPADAVVLVGDPKAYERQRAAVDAHVRGGGRAVFYRLPPGRWRLGDREAVIRVGAMNAREFVSRATGHPLVEGLEARDFAYWYDARRDHIGTLLTDCCEPEGWDALLLSCNQGEDKSWRPVLAAGTAVFGAGSLTVCQLELNDRLCNPTARLFVERMLGPVHLYDWYGVEYDGAEETTVVREGSQTMEKKTEP
jgi:hypothetical protein